MPRFYALALMAATLLALSASAQRSPADAYSSTSMMVDETLLVPPADIRAQFGASVAIDGDHAVVGAPVTNSVYVFVRTGSGWSLQQTLVPVNIGGIDQSNAQFGASVAIDDGIIVVGMPGAITGGIAGVGGGVVTGGAYVFALDVSATPWTRETILFAPTASREAGDVFGTAVAVSGERIIVGASGARTSNGPNSGEAYVFLRDPSTTNPSTATTEWPLEATLSLGAAGSRGDLFASAVAISDERALIGARDASTRGTNAGAAHVFVRAGADWSLEETLYNMTISEGDKFGQSVAMSDDVIAIGAPYDDGAEGTQGSVTVYSLSALGWIEDEVLYADDERNANFGYSVDVDSDLVKRLDRVIGGAFQANRFATDGGAAFVFERNRQDRLRTITLTETLGASNASGGAQFGYSVGLDGGQAVVGAPFAEAAYAFIDIRPIDNESSPDVALTLGAPQPNPVTGRAALALSVGEPQHIRAELVDALGRRVQTLLDGPASGTLDLGVEVAGLAPGIYAVVVRGETASAVRRLTVVR